MRDFLTLAAVLANRATSDPNAPYLRDREDVLTFGQVESQAGALAVGLELDGSGLLPESVGQIAVRGPGVMLRYYRQPGETAAAFDEDRYFLTGDLGLLDENGFLCLVGRLKDVIIRFGFNVHPWEVEARIEAHPAVQEVAAVGITDSLLGEAICACIVPVEGAIVTGQEVMDWSRDTLAEDKVPDFVRFIDELPRTDTVQVRRTDLSLGSA